MNIIGFIKGRLVRLADNRKYKCHRRFMREHGTPPRYIKVLDCMAYGATLGWGFTPVREVRFKYLCTECGEKFYIYIGGFTIIDDKKRNPEQYNREGWPLDNAGNKLPIIR